MVEPRDPPTTLLSWGELLWDLFPDTERLGGAAANVAYHAARIGARSVLVSRVGNDDLGRRARAALAQAEIVTELIQVDPRRPTGTVRVELDDGEPRYRIANEVAWDRIESTPDLARWMQRANVLCFSTLAQRSEPGFATLERAMAELPSHALRFCDLNVRRPFVSRSLIEHALALASAVKLNEAEAALIGQMFDARDPVQWLLDHSGIDVVALTRGARGALVTSAVERVDAPGVPLTGQDGDRVGAGDSFVAVMAVVLARGRPLDVGTRLATRYSSAVASQPGGMPAIVPDLAELESS